MYSKRAPSEKVGLFLLSGPSTKVKNMSEPRIKQIMGLHRWQGAMSNDEWQ